MNDTRLKLHGWDLGNVHNQDARMVQHCPPSCAHRRPQLVEVVNVLLAHVPCEQTKLVENLLRPLWMKSFLRTFQKINVTFRKNPSSNVPVKDSLRWSCSSRRSPNAENGWHATPPVSICAFGALQWMAKIVLGDFTFPSTTGTEVLARSQLQKLGLKSL